MKEYSCQFGPLGRLTGVVTEPQSKSVKLACILVSAGLVPKFGPYRLYVLIARRLAACGVRVLRLDLGGIGDSGVGEGNLPLKVRTEHEISAAVEYLARQHGATKIVLGGLCSGAEDSFRFAEHDERICGVAMIDPFGYRTPGWGWRHFLFRGRRRLLHILNVYEPVGDPSAAGAVSVGGADSLIKYHHMDHAESERILRALVARNVRSLFIYTGGMSESFNHPGQLKKMFPQVDFQDRVTVEHLPQMEHTQMLEEDRAAVVEAISRWFEAGWGSSN